MTYPKRCGEPAAGRAAAPAAHARARRSLKKKEKNAGAGARGRVFAAPAAPERRQWQRVIYIPTGDLTAARIPSNRMEPSDGGAAARRTAWDGASAPTHSTDWISSPIVPSCFPILCFFFFARPAVPARRRREGANFAPPRPVARNPIFSASEGRIQRGTHGRGTPPALRMIRRGGGGGGGVPVPVPVPVGPGGVIPRRIPEVFLGRPYRSRI